jgi:alpha-D-xyloside xylohydrolase
MKLQRFTPSILLTAVVGLVTATGMAAPAGGEELTPTVAEVAPGVYRLRAGQPEPIVPSLVRLAARMDALKAMPQVKNPPLPIQRIKIVRTARGCRIELPLKSSETIYGLGLQCKHLEQNGWRRTLFAAAGDDNGKGMSHAPVPFYVSTAGYGVLVDSARYLTFSVGEKQRLANLPSLTGPGKESKVITDVAELYGAEQRDATSIYVDVPVARGVDIYLFAGPAMGQAVARYNLFSGGGCMPALEGMGPRYQFGAMLDAKAVLAMCDQFKQDRIPFTVGGAEVAWETRAYPSSYEFNTTKFPEDIGELVRQKGYGLGLWCQLYIHPESPFMSILGNRFGDFEVWGGVVPDMADPAVRNAYRDFWVNNFIRKGIANFKLDEVDGSGNTQQANQEWQFPEFTVFPSGADGELMRNLLGRFGLQAIDEAFRKENRRTFGLVRANQAWAAPMPVVLYSDEYNFADFIRYALSAGVQGLLWAPEVRDADNDRDLALRLGAAAFSSDMVINAWQFPHPPWQQPNIPANERNQLLPEDNPYLRITRRFNNLRMALLPYLYQAYGDYHRKGISPVRHLVADWPEDLSTWHIDDQWMLGSDLLVAPVTDLNAFTEIDRVALTNAAQFKADAGVQMKFQDDILTLDIANPNGGLTGGSMEFDLKPGSCLLRISARGEINRMDMRLLRIDKDQAADVEQLYKTIRLDPDHWNEQTYRFNVPHPAHYRLLVGKGYFVQLPKPKRLELRNVAFEQFQGDPQQSWKRQVYLPAGAWRDFWTGAPLAGGRSHTMTATAERPLVFVRAGTLLPLAEPLVTVNDKTLFTIHLAAYGENPRPCQLLEDDGTTIAYEKGEWATLTVTPDGALRRPDHGQPPRYRIAGPAEQPATLIERLINRQQ